MQPDSNWLELTGLLACHFHYSIPCIFVCLFLYFCILHVGITQAVAQAMARELSRPFTSFGAGLPFRSSVQVYWLAIQSQAPLMQPRSPNDNQGATRHTPLFSFFTINITVKGIEHDAIFSSIMLPKSTEK